VEDLTSRKSWSAFLESTPPGVLEAVNDLFTEHPTGHWFILRPPLQLYCRSEECDRSQLYDQEERISDYNNSYYLLLYRCRNCKKSQKVFAVYIQQEERMSNGQALKLGEHPPFGPPTPARVISLIGPDRDLFLKGRRAEIQGLGIGAFAYYRRVVENQKTRILTEIAKVATRVGASPEGERERFVSYFR
jgi:hypothetical protein